MLLQHTQIDLVNVSVGLVVVAVVLVVGERLQCVHVCVLLCINACLGGSKPVV